MACELQAVGEEGEWIGILEEIDKIRGVGGWGGGGYE